MSNILDNIEAVATQERRARRNTLPSFVSVEENRSERFTYPESVVYDVRVKIGHRVACDNAEHLAIAKENVRKGFSNYIFGEQIGLVTELQILLHEHGYNDRVITEAIDKIVRSMK